MVHPRRAEPHPLDADCSAHIQPDNAHLLTYSRWRFGTCHTYQLGSGAVLRFPVKFGKLLWFPCPDTIMRHYDCQDDTIMASKKSVPPYYSTGIQISGDTTTFAVYQETDQVRKPISLPPCVKGFCWSHPARMEPHILHPPCAGTPPTNSMRSHHLTQGTPDRKIKTACWSVIFLSVSMRATSKHARSG